MIYFNRSIAALTIIIVSGVLIAQDADIEAIKRYWLTEHPSPPHDVALGQETFGIKRIEDWPFLKRLKHHRLYFFKEKTWFRSPYPVVSVDDFGTVYRVDSLEGFNQLLSKESINIDNIEDAEEIVQTFLRLRYFSGIKIWGWNLGVNVIENVSDIPFSTSDEAMQQRNFIERKYQIRPPRIEQKGNEYNYIFFTWSPSFGTLKYFDIILEKNGIKTVKKHKLAEEIGDYGTY